MKKILVLLLALVLLTINSGAQSITDNLYVTILKEELQRNINRLRLPDLEKPFFIGYNLRNQNTYTLFAERGQILNSRRDTISDKSASVKLRVGDYHRNFDYMIYDGSFIDLPQQADADEYKRLLWLETDRAYKNNSQQYSNFISSLNRLTVDKEELELDDMAKIKPIVQDYGPIQPLHINKDKWEQILRALSALFIPYPNLSTSNCQLTVTQYEDYLVTSEGTTIRKPGGYVNFRVFASTIADEESDNLNEVYSIVVRDIADLPSEEQLRVEVKKLIEKINKKQSAKAFTDSYMGPVLFTGDAVVELFNQTFGNTLSTKRKSILGYDGVGNYYEEKLGQKLVSSDLSVTAIPALQYYQEKKITGHYKVDDEGVTPPDSMILIQNGILKSLLNGRTPTKKFPLSNGFTQSFMGKSYSPGVLRVTSSNTIPNDSMKVRLLKLAKEEGLAAAYIIKDYAYNDVEIYKVDVATGKEEIVNECTLTQPGMRGLRRFVTASNNYQLYNMYDASIICPQSIIINEIEIEKKTNTSKPKPIIVTNPLLDKKQQPIKKTAKI